MIKAEVTTKRGDDMPEEKEVGAGSEEITK